MKDWYDNGEGSENMKRSIAKNAKENPVRPAICVRCEFKMEVERLRAVLEKLARLGNGDQYGNSDGNVIARQALERK